MNDNTYTKTKDEAEEALSLAVREGIIHPLAASEMTEERLMQWFEDGLIKKDLGEIPE